MAAGSTYTPIATQTLGSATASVTFSSIAGTYTDLVLVCNLGSTSGGSGIGLRFNSDAGNNYSATALLGTGTAASSYRTSTQTKLWVSYNNGSGTTASSNTLIINIQNYANTTTNKSTLAQSMISTNGVEITAGLWASTAAINSVAIFSDSTFVTGSTFTLYGITAA